MDKAALLTPILKRNAIRKEAQLPLLDVRQELEKACANARLDEWFQFIDDKKSDWDRIETEVLTEMRAKHGPQFPSGSLGRLGVYVRTMKRFREFAEIHYGVRSP